MATVTWNALSSGFWDNTSNWDSTAIPTSSDDVLFNSTSVKDCTLNLDATINSFTVASTYTGGIDATGYSYLCYNDYLDEGTGSKYRHYGRGIHVTGNSARVSFGSGLGTVVASQCYLLLDGTTAMKLYTTKQVNFKNLTLGQGAYVTHAGGRMLLTDTTCPFKMGADSTFINNQSIWEYLDGPGSYFDLPSSYSLSLNAEWSCRNSGLSGSLVNSIPNIRLVTTAGNFSLDNFGADRTFNIGNFVGSGGTCYFRNYSGVAPGTALFNFSSDFTCGSFNAGNANAGAKTSWNYGSGNFVLSNTYRIDQYVSSSDGTFNFTSSKWSVAGNWTEGSVYSKDPGTSIITFNTNKAIITPNGKPFYDITLNQATKNYSAVGALSCHNLTLTAGNWSNNASSVTCSNNASFDGVGTLDLGTGFNMTGNSGTFHIGSTIGTMVSPSQCDLVFTGTVGMFLGVDKYLANFKSLTLGAGAKVTNNGTDTIYFSGSSTLLTLGASASFTSSYPFDLFPTANMTVFSFGADSTFVNNQDIRVRLNTASTTVTVPAITTTGGGGLFFITGTNNTTFNLAGNMTLGAALGIGCYEGSSLFTFNTNNYSIYSGSYSPGNINGGIAVINYGSSSINVLSYEGAVRNAGTLTENFGSSQWISRDVWTNGTNSRKNHAWDTVTFKGGNTQITSAGKYFNWVYLNCTGTATLVDKFVCREYKRITGTLNKNGQQYAEARDTIQGVRLLKRDIASEINTMDSSTLASQWKVADLSIWTADYATLGFSGADSYNHVITYPALNVPKFATILSAIPSWVSFNDSSGAGCNVNLYFTAADNPSHPPSAYAADALTLTSSYVPFNDVQDWGTGTRYYGPDVKYPLQSIIDRTGWNYGNKVQLVCKDNTSTVGIYRSGYGSSLYNLDVRYTVNLRTIVNTADANTLCNQWQPTDLGTWANPGWSTMSFEYSHVITYPALNVPKGSTILSAIPRYVCGSANAASTVTMNMYLTDASDATHPSNATQAQAISPLTSAVLWKNIPAWTLDSTYYGPDLSTILQTVVNRADWTYGNNIQLVVKNNGSTASSPPYRAGFGNPHYNLEVTYM